MYLLMILLSRGRMSDYADSSSGYGAEVFTVILIIGFVYMQLLNVGDIRTNDLLSWN